MLAGVVPIGRPSINTRAPRGLESTFMVPANVDRVTAGLRGSGATARPDGGRGEGRSRDGAAVAARSRCIPRESVRVGSLALKVTSSRATV